MVFVDTFLASYVSLNMFSRFIVIFANFLNAMGRWNFYRFTTSLSEKLRRVFLYSKRVAYTTVLFRRRSIIFFLFLLFFYNCIIFGGLIFEIGKKIIFFHYMSYKYNRFLLNLTWYNFYNQILAHASYLVHFPQKLFKFVEKIAIDLSIVLTRNINI